MRSPSEDPQGSGPVRRERPGGDRMGGPRHPQRGARGRQRLESAAAIALRVEAVELTLAACLFNFLNRSTTRCGSSSTVAHPPARS